MGVISKRCKKHIASCLKDYADLMEMAIIMSGASERNFNKNMKEMRKMIKKIKKEKPEKVFDLEVLAKYREMLENEAARAEAAKGEYNG